MSDKSFILNENRWADENTPLTNEGEGFTFSGTVMKILLLLGIAVATALGTFFYFQSNAEFINQMTTQLLIGTIVGAGILGITIAFVPSFAPVLSPIYAIAEGGLLGVLTYLVEKSHPCAAMPALITTFSLALFMMMVFHFFYPISRGILMGIYIAVGGICLAYVAELVMMAFGLSVTFMHQGGWLGLGINAVVVVVATVSLLADFQFIMDMSKKESQAPKYLEWYAAFGVLVTIIWMYIEILKLLSRGGNPKV